MLYMRRRTQLLRENAMRSKDNGGVSSEARRNYLHLRNQILEQKYGLIDQNQSGGGGGKSSSKANSKALSVDSMSLNYDWRDSLGARKAASMQQQQQTGGGGQLRNASIYSSKESLTSNNNNNNCNTAASSSLGGRSKKYSISSVIEDVNSFAGIHHMFDGLHKGASTTHKQSIKYIFLNE
jgi:hypothetical protein